MTREEAKDYIREWCPYDRQEEIIKALEQETSDDAVSRQYLIEKAISWKKHFHDSERYVGLTDIQNAPPVTPQQKVGHWIFVDKAKEHARCSECDYGDVDLVDGRVHDYCEKCGARMAEPPVESEGK